MRDETGDLSQRGDTLEHSREPENVARLQNLRRRYGRNPMTRSAFNLHQIQLMQSAQTCLLDGLVHELRGTPSADAGARCTLDWAARLDLHGNHELPLGLGIGLPDAGKIRLNIVRVFVEGLRKAGSPDRRCGRTGVLRVNSRGRGGLWLAGRFSPASPGLSLRSWRRPEWPDNRELSTQRCTRVLIYSLKSGSKTDVSDSVADNRSVLCDLQHSRN